MLDACAQRVIELASEGGVSVPSAQAILWSCSKLDYRHEGMLRRLCDLMMSAPAPTKDPHMNAIVPMWCLASLAYYYRPFFEWGWKLLQSQENVASLALTHVQARDIVAFHLVSPIASLAKHAGWGDSSEG